MNFSKSKTLFRNIHISLLATSILFAANVKALSVENADAFVEGDGKAMYDHSSGLTWLDFGVNNYTTFYDVTSQLGSGQYSGWRLATEAEVLHLFKGLLPEFSVPDTVVEPFSQQVQSEDFSPHWSEINSLWGVNEAQPNLGENNGHQLFSYVSTGLFLGDNGDLYGAGLHDFTFSTEVNPGNNYYGQISLFTTFEAGHLNYEESARVSTLLVRDTPLGEVAEVPEPGTLALFSLGFGSLLLSRLRRKNSDSKL